MPSSQPRPPQRPSAVEMIKSSLSTRRTQLVLAAFFVWICILVLVARTFEEPAAVQLFLTASAAVLVGTNFASRPRAPGEMSAYSVFNPGGAPLLGQLRAEQFDAEVRHRPTEWDLDDNGGDPLGGGGAGENGHGGGFANGHGNGVGIARGNGTRATNAFDGVGRRLGAGPSNDSSSFGQTREEEDRSNALDATRREIFMEARRARLAGAAARRR